MTCDHAACDEPATTACRMGTGYVTRKGVKPYRQSYVRYCDPHLQQVDRLFVLCDVRLLSDLEGTRAGGGIHLRR